MSLRRYHDFVILTDDPEIGPDGKLARFTVRVFQSPAGEGERKEPVSMPDEHGTIPSYGVLNAQRRRLGERRLDQREQIAYGQVLGRVLLPPYARELLRRSLAELGPGEGVRIRLRLLRELARFPWEYVHIQDEGQVPSASGFLALNPRISIVRHEAIAMPPEKIPPGDVRRMLIAMATPGPHQVYEPLSSLPAEQREIRVALSKIEGLDIRCLPDYGGSGEWDTIAGASPAQVQAAIQTFEHVDIFHFSGHGDFSTEMAPLVGEEEGHGYIVMADGNNQAVQVPADRLQELLGEQGIRLVTLGACETGTRDIFHAWSSVAAALLKGRIPSVVAMQFRVRDQFAAAFMAAVYQGLVAGSTIDQAVSSGRAAIRALSYGELAEAPDWGTPVLYSRVPGGCLFPPVEDAEARQQAQQGLDVRSSLHQAWWDWTDHRATASVSQLRYLAGLGESLEVQPTEALLLLRSAVMENEPIGPWLAHLRRMGGGLIAGLDDPAVLAVAADREEASVFALGDVPQEERPRDVGPVAWVAARHPSETARHTAALALTALMPVPMAGLERIDGALGGIESPWKRFARRAELRGALADGDPGIGEANADLPPWDRLGIWLWRFWRRAFHDWERILLLIVGGAVGASIGLGVLRALEVGLLLLVRPDVKTPAYYLYMYSWLGALVGASICLGMLLAGPALLRPMRRRGEQRQAPQGWQVQMLAVLLGTLFLGLCLAVLAGIRDIPIEVRRPVSLLGFPLGLGLSLALYGQPRAGRPLGLAAGALRLCLAAAVSAGIQAVLISTMESPTALDIALSPNFFTAWLTGMSLDWWLNPLSLIDAALAGAVLAAGIGWGLNLADKLARWLLDLKERAGV